jgi:hypothetical protein
MTRVVLVLAALLGWAAYAQASRRGERAKLFGRQSDAFPFPTGAAVKGIDLDDAASVREWREAFDCTEEQLRAAVRHVGNAPADVRRHLARPR